MRANSRRPRRYCQAYKPLVQLLLHLSSLVPCYPSVLEDLPAELKMRRSFEVASFMPESWAVLALVDQLES